MNLISEVKNCVEICFKHGSHLRIYQKDRLMFPNSVDDKLIKILMSH